MTSVGSLLVAILGGAAVGWGTNVVAVRMLFRPQHSISLGPWQVQGVFPCRQQDIASRLGAIAAQELLPPEALRKALVAPQTVEALRHRAMDAVEKRLNAVLGRTPLGLGDRVARGTCEAIDAELRRVLPQVLGRAADVVASQLDVHSLVEERLACLAPGRLEDLLVGVLSRELRWVEVAGGVLGAFVGAVHWFLWMA